MTEQVDIEGVLGAFEVLREQLEATKTQINDRIVGAARAGNYDDVKELIEKEEAVDKIIDQADTLLVQLAAEFGPSPDLATPDPPPKRPHARSSTGSIRLVLKNRYCDARAMYNRGSVVVLRGSTLAFNERDSLQDIYRERRRELQRRGQLTTDSAGRALILNADCRFNSPSGAACFVVGYSANGKQVWKVEGTGKSLGETLDAKTG